MRDTDCLVDGAIGWSMAQSAALWRNQVGRAGPTMSPETARAPDHPAAFRAKIASQV
jgi:hypothetical protein